MQTHTLSPEEVDLITSILDAEEKNIDNLYANGTSLTMLDAQCREIWPNWETSQRTSPSRYSSSFSMRNRNSPSYDDETNTPIKTSVYDNVNNNNRKTPYSQKRSNTSNVSPVSSNYSPRQNSPSDNRDMQTFEFQNMKTDIDNLYNRIQLMSSGSGSSSPASQQLQKPQQKSETKQKYLNQQNVSTPSSYRSTRTAATTPRTVASPISKGSSKSDDIQKIKAENYMLKAQLEKVQKLLEIEQEQNKKLQAALRKATRKTE